MSQRIGPVAVLPPEGDPRLYGVSEGLLDAVAEETRRIIDECYREALRVLVDNRARLDAIVEQLLVNETLDEADVYAAAGIPPPKHADPAPAALAPA